MALMKIKPHMLENIPGSKIPEIVSARGGAPSLEERLKHVVNKTGDTIDGPLVLSGGVTVPEDASLVVDGDTELRGVTILNNIPTGGVFGVSTVVANSNDVQLLRGEETPICIFSPNLSGNYLIYIYFRVEDPSADVEVDIRYSDRGGEKLQKAVNGGKIDKGAYSLASIFINSVAQAPISITAISYDSREVYVSASIVGL